MGASSSGVLRMVVAVFAMLVLGVGLMPATAAPGAPPEATPGPVTMAFEPAMRERIDAGDEHTCAVDDAGAVRCWGLNSVGQLGHGNNAFPVRIEIGDDETPASAGVVDLGGTAALKVASGADHSCAVLVDASVACWGHNTNGILGSGAQDPNDGAIGDDEVPGAARVVLGPNRTAKAIAAGGNHTCVITNLDKVLCWGNGDFGELGYGSTADIGDDETPGSAGIVDLGAGRTVKGIAAGARHTCALMNNGEVLCWGDNGGGQLGHPDIDHVGDDETPASVGTVDLGVAKALRLTAGDGYTCAVLDNNKLRCWGGGTLYGAIGSGVSQIPPDSGHVNLAGVDVLQVGAGSDHTCAVLTGAVQDVRCWGRGTHGRLGLPGLGPIENVGDDEAPSAYPVLSLAGDSFTAVTAGQMHTCAVTTAGRVRCWGNNSVGAIGHAGGSFDLGDDETPGSIGPIVLGALITCNAWPLACAV